MELELTNYCVIACKFCHPTDEWNYWMHMLLGRRVYLHPHSRLPITQTLANFNLALTQTKIDFPWISFIQLLFCSNFTLGNSNPLYLKPPATYLKSFLLSFRLLLCNLTLDKYLNPVFKHMTSQNKVVNWSLKHLFFFQNNCAFNVFTSFVSPI